MSEPLFCREVEVVVSDVEESTWFVELHPVNKNATVNTSKQSETDFFIIVLNYKGLYDFLRDFSSLNASFGAFLFQLDTGEWFDDVQRLKHKLRPG